MRLHKELYRDPDKGRIGGVCAGVAEYFGLEVWLVRILTVTGFFLLAGPFMLVAYIAAWFILDKKPSSTMSKTKSEAFAQQFASKIQKGKGWHNENAEPEEKIEVKSKVWQSGEPPRQAYFDIKQKYKRIEGRLRKVETYVTSSEYQLNREINKL
jgi:phage shock protein C